MSEPLKRYKLLKDISLPGNLCKDGTESIRWNDYYAFPYEGRYFNGGWMGNAYLCKNPQDDPVFFELVTDTVPEHPSNDNAFVWTDELVAECHEYIKGDAAGTLTPYGVMKNIEQFKQFKQPLSTLMPDAKGDKPDWEIRRLLVGNENYWLGKNGFYQSGFDSIDFTAVQIMAWNDFRGIHSVIRISDNCLFTVGDKISWGVHYGYESTLTGFEIKEGRLKFHDERNPRKESPCDFLNAVNLRRLP